MKVYQLILLIAFITALLKKDQQIRTLPLWLGFVCMVELCISPLSNQKIGNNFLVLNLYSLLSVIYWFTIFNAKTKLGINGKILKATFILWTIAGLIRYMRLSLSSPLENVIYIIGLSIIAAQVITYFSILLNTNKEQLTNNAMVILGIGFLLFYTASFPIIVFVDILVTNLNAARAYSDLLAIGNIFLSLSYLGATLCSKTES